MSAKNVDAFFAKVQEDKKLQSKLSALHKKIQKESKDESASAIVKIASAAGFKFTAKDWNQQRKAKAQKAAKAEVGGVTGQMYCENMTYDYCTSNHTCVATSWY